MAIDPENNSFHDAQSPSRLKQLKVFDKDNRQRQGFYYSRFVRILRLTLPLIAIGIVSVLLAWPKLEDTIEPIPRSHLLPKTVASNELLEPHFESVDEKNQPYEISANRALQNNKDSDIVFLEEPRANITLNNGAYISAKATKGAYRQHEETLLLEGHVKLFHDQGYEMGVEKIFIDLKQRTARSEVPVNGHGPDGKIEAQGLQINSEQEILLFKGPATLTLYKKIEGL